jgi:hypothetical protein
MEVAHPYLDYGAVDLLLTVPRPLRNSGALFLELYRQRWPALGRIVWTHTGVPLLSSRWARAAHWRLEHLQWRIKRVSGGRIAAPNRQAVTNYPDWFRGPLASWLQGLLLAGRPASRDLVDRRVVERLWREHHARQANHTAALGALATLELWCRQTGNGHGG